MEKNTVYILILQIKTYNIDWMEIDYYGPFTEEEADDAIANTPAPKAEKGERVEYRYIKRKLTLFS